MNDTGGPADHIATLLAEAPTTRDQLVDRLGGWPQWLAREVKDAAWTPLL